MRTDDLRWAAVLEELHRRHGPRFVFVASRKRKIPTRALTEVGGGASPPAPPLPLAQAESAPRGDVAGDDRASFERHVGKAVGVILGDLASDLVSGVRDWARTRADIAAQRESRTASPMPNMAMPRTEISVAELESGLTEDHRGALQDGSDDQRVEDLSILPFPEPVPLLPTGESGPAEDHYVPPERPPPDSDRSGFIGGH